MTNAYQAILEPITKINKDIIAAMRAGGDNGLPPMSATEVRFLVDFYYMIQKQRVQNSNRVKGLERDAKKAQVKEEPHELLDWAFNTSKVFESQLKRALSVYVETHEMKWFFDQTLGVGPVIAAGLLAHIDITKAPTAGHIWNFAGLNPDIEWKKGKKKPFNGQLKTLCWKAGDSFVKLSNRKDAFYSQVYKERKQIEIERNESLKFSDQAKRKLEKFNIDKKTDAYKAYSVGKLPPAHIDMRARRYAVKLFLSHLQYRWWEQTYGEAPAKPYAIAILGHAHLIEPPQIPSAIITEAKQ